MPLATAPSTHRERSQAWNLAILSVVGIVSLALLFGAVHWYNGYARSLPPAFMSPRPPEKGSSAEKPKPEKAVSAEKHAAKADGSAGASTATDQADGAQTESGDKRSGHKGGSKPTATPGV